MNFFNRCKNAVFGVSGKAKALVAAGVLSVSTGASAALPTGATDALTSIQTDGSALIDAGWPIVVAITGGMILIKLFKKVVGRVT